MATLMDLMMGRATQQLGQAGQSRMQLPAINLPPNPAEKLIPLGRPDLLDLMQGNNGTVYVGNRSRSEFELPGVPALPRVQFQQPQAAAPAPQLPSMMAYAPNQFGGLNTAPAVAPASAPVAPIQSATSTTAPAAPSIFNRIFSGEDYQSNSMPVVMAPQGPGMTGAPLPQTVNWGDPENAADYFRAAAAAQRIGLL
jgi:hypothetical protein